jgi:hypothetical protein
MRRTTPAEWLAIWASNQAAITSAIAPLFGNNPAEMGAIGFSIGLVTGLPVYLVAVVTRIRRRA